MLQMIEKFETDRRKNPMLKVLGISSIWSIFIMLVYHLATYKFDIPFCYTIGVGLIVFLLVFFVLNDLI